MDIKINVTPIKLEAPELVHALNNLADAMRIANDGGNALQAIKTEVAENSTVEKKQETVKEIESEVNVEAAPVVETEPVVVPEENEEHAISIEQIRAKFADLARAGKKDEVKALIAATGAAKLSDIPAEKYKELMAEAEKIGQDGAA